MSAIHSTVLTATNVFLDLLTSPSHLSFYAILRAEASTVFPTPSFWLDSTSTAKLNHTDSTIRESLRQNPTIARVATRQVVPKNGIILPSGHHLPQGAWLGCSALGIQNERFYAEPEKYDPFRLSKAREEMTARERDGVRVGGEKTGEKTLDGGMLVTTSDKILAFGHGRQAWYVFLTSPFLLLIIILLILLPLLLLLPAITNPSPIPKFQPRTIPRRKSTQNAPSMYHFKLRHGAYFRRQAFEFRIWR